MEHRCLATMTNMIDRVQICITHILAAYYKTQIHNSAYLNLPPPICGPRLMNNPSKVSTIMLVQTLHVPNKVQCQQGILQQVHSPIPQWSCMYIEFDFLLLVRDGDDMLLKLYGLYLNTQ